jgi:DNA-binding IclR family transcriptional regulator
MTVKINSVDKAITVLNCFSTQEPVQSVGEISKSTGHTLSTVSRLLSTMEARGVVQKAKGHGRYRLGYRVYLWGLMSQSQNNLAAVARPSMEALRDRCQEEVSLHIVIDGVRTCLERVPSTHAIAMNVAVGGRLPLHAGAAGRVLLAFMDSDSRRQYIEEVGLKRYTESTFTDPIRLEAELKKIRQRGYAISREEREPGSCSVVAPVRAAGDRVVASLCLAGPLYRMNENSLKAHTSDVQSAAAEISQKLGYNTP